MNIDSEIGFVKKRTVWLVLFCFLVQTDFTGCAFWKPGSSWALTTIYPNGQSKTHFEVLGRSDVRNILLHDSSGGVVFKRDSISNDVKCRDTAYSDSTEIKRITKELSLLFDGLASRSWNTDGVYVDGEIHFRMWINSHGGIDHVIFFHYKNVTKEFLKYAVEEMEKWKLSNGFNGKDISACQRLFLEWPKGIQVKTRS